MDVCANLVCLIVRMLAHFRCKSVYHSVFPLYICPSVITSICPSGNKIIFYLFVRLLTSRALFPVYMSLVLPLYIFFSIPSVYLFVRLLTTIFSSSTFEQILPFVYMLAPSPPLSLSSWFFVVLHSI